MDYRTFIIPGIAAVILALVFGTFFFLNQDTKTFSYATKTSSGTVTIDLTPVAIKNNQLVFTVNLNTHTVDLEQYNLQMLTTLSYNGKNVKPLNSILLAGHHNTGELVFPVEGKPEHFNVVIIGIPDVSMREFAW
ncbi:hypothetical protein HZB00_02730 [Candidatus Woesearchaeota archaeon]|nr:hypothetical protein [Candidatus Woesearchaeota archaeon]